MNWLFTRHYLAVWIAIVISLATSNLSWAQTINVTSNVSPTTNLCTNSAISLTFSTTGVFTAGNIFSLQRSDEAGVFAVNPQVVGTLAAVPTSATSLTVSGNLGTLPYGTNYRFRVVSSQPTITSNPTPGAVTVGTNVPAVQSNYTFCQNSGPQSISATGTGIIEWYTSSAANAPVVATGSTYNIPTNISGTTTYYVTQAVNGCKSEKVSVAVTVSAPTTAPGVTTPAAYCPGAGPSVLTATTTGTGTTIQWVSSSGTQTGATIPAPQTTGTYTYTVSQADSRGCTGANSTVVSVTVNQAPASAPVANIPAPYCADAIPGPLTATLSGGATSLKWYNLSNNTTFTTPTIPAPTTTTQYQVSQLTGNCEGPRSLAFTVTVNPKPVDPTLNSAGPFCQNSGTNATQTITANGQNIEWFTSASSTSAIATGTSFQISTAGGNLPVYFRQVVNGCASNRVTATVTVNPTPGTAPQFTPPPTYCSNSTPGTLSVTLTNSATSARWYIVGGGSTNGVSIPAPTTTTQYQVSQFIGSCEGPRSAVFTVNVTPKPANPSPGITGPFCQNSGSNNVQTVTATGTGTLEWFVNATTPNVATTGASYTVSTAIASPQTVYYRQVVDGCPSDRIAMTVVINSIPPAPTYTQPRDYCAEDMATPLTANGNGLLWYAAQTGGSGSSQAPTPGTAATNVGTPQLFYVTQTLNGCESPRQTIAVTVKRKPAPPATTSSLSLCQTTTPVSLSAQGESGASLIWITNGVESPTAPSLPSTIAGNYTYQVVQVLNGCRSNPASVVATVKPTPAAPTVTPYSLCVGRESRSPEVVGSELRYYSANDQFLGTTAPVLSTAQSTTFTYRVSQTIEGCEGPKATYNVPVYPIPGVPAFTQPKDYCAEESATPLVATGQGLLWYTTATGGPATSQAPTPSTSANNVGVGQTFYVTQTINGCESIRQAISVTVKRKPGLPTTQTNPEFCQNSGSPTLTATPENGASIIWVVNGTERQLGPTQPTNTVGFYSYQVLQELNGCRSNQANVTVRVKVTPGQPAITPFDLCQSGPGRALEASGSELKYYDVSNAPLGSTAPVVNTDNPRTFTYRVSQTIEGCEGPKIDYSVVVKPKPAPPATQAINYCVENSSNPDQPRQNVQPLTAQGQNLRWFFVDGNPYPESFTPSPSIASSYAADYRVTQTVNGCASDQALLRVTVQATPTPIVSSSLVTFCRNGVSRPLEATGTNLRWIDPNGVLTDQTPTPPTANATKGGEAYQVYSIGPNGCVSPRNTIRLVINTNPTLGLLGSTTVNYGQSTSLSLRFTSSPPYSYTLSDGTSGVANDTISSVTVKPLQTTIYQVASVSNVCGSGLPGNPATATIFVNIPVITTQALTVGTICAGSSFGVTYATTGVFQPGNAFKVQIADTTSKNYVDVSPAGLGTTLNATIPASLKGGVYFVRVLATNPGAELPGLRSPTLLTVRGLPAAVLSGTQNIYEGSPGSLSIALSGDGPWTITYGFTADGSQPSTSTFETSTNPHILSVQPPKTATYFLTSVSNSCSTGPVSGTATVTVLTVLAVENPLLNTVSLYPVPTQNLLTVAIDLPLTRREPAQLTLLDLTGMPVLTRQTDARQTVLDLSQQPAGLYLLNIQVGEHRMVRKIMKF